MQTREDYLASQRHKVPGKEKSMRFRLILDCDDGCDIEVHGFVKSYWDVIVEGKDVAECQERRNAFLDYCFVMERESSAKAIKMEAVVAALRKHTALSDLEVGTNQHGRWEGIPRPCRSQLLGVGVFQTLQFPS